MREIEHAEHAEDDGEAARHQEQQHAEQNAVQRGDDDQFEHGAPPLGDKGPSAPAIAGAREACAVNADYFGRSILQVVGSMVCGGVDLGDHAASPNRSFPRRTVPFRCDRRTRRYTSAGRTGDRPCAWCPCRRRRRRTSCLRALRDLDRIERLGLVGGDREHPHLVDGARIEQAEVVFGAERLLELLRRLVVEIRECLRRSGTPDD